MAASITVTAAQSGAGAQNGMALTVKVVNNAAAVGATASSATVTTPQLAITPSATGSWIYGALNNIAVNTAFTANASTTFTQNVPDATHVETYGTFRSTATTTSGTPVTVGASAPAEVAGKLFIALCEIEAAAGQSLAEDASSPAVLSTTTAQTLTTAAFTPPPTAWLVAMVSSNASGTSGQSMAITVSGGGRTWVQQSSAVLSPGAGATEVLVSVWTSAPIALFTPPPKPSRGARAAGRGRAASSAGTVTGPAPFKPPRRPSAGTSKAGRGRAASSAGTVTGPAPFKPPRRPSAGTSKAGRGRAAKPNASAFIPPPLPLPPLFGGGNSGGTIRDSRPRLGWGAITGIPGRGAAVERPAGRGYAGPHPERADDLAHDWGEAPPPAAPPGPTVGEIVRDELTHISRGVLALGQILAPEPYVVRPQAKRCPGEKRVGGRLLRCARSAHTEGMHYADGLYWR